MKTVVHKNINSYLIIDNRIIVDCEYMGIKFDKIPISRSNMICPPRFDDLTTAGSVYLVIHKPREGETENQTEKKRHFSFAMDVTGIEKKINHYLFSSTILDSSTLQTFTATHIDLYVTSRTDHQTYISCTMKSRPWNHYSLVQQVGKIPIDEIQSYPTTYVFAEQIRFAIMPIVMDIYLSDSLIANQSTEKYNENLDKIQIRTRNLELFYRFVYRFCIHSIKTEINMMINKNIVDYICLIKNLNQIYFL